MSNHPRDKRDICCKCDEFYHCCDCFSCCYFKQCEQDGFLTHGCSPCRRFEPTALFASKNRTCRNEVAEHLRRGA